MKYLPNTLERQWHDVQLLETDSFHHMSPDGTCLLCQSSIMQQKCILFLHFIESCASWLFDTRHKNVWSAATRAFLGSV